MNTKHPEGYWVNQLSDENILTIAKKLLSENEKFIKIDQVKKLKDKITTKLHYEKTNTYLRIRDAEITINDFEVRGKIHTSSKFYTYMIDLFGNDYAIDLIEHLEELISSLEKDTSHKKGLINFKNKIEDNLNQNNTTL